ncbi:MAG: protein translocase subunit SecF [Gammaproteobacteria bacterium]|nr:protein translocase subunit SecF [Gammaproteobacteria bacterium]
MQIFKNKSDWDFMGKRKIAIAVSLVLLLVSIGSLVTRQLELGIDFTGGVLIEVGYPEAAQLDQIRTAITAAGYPDATVQNFGTARDVLIRLAPEDEKSSAEISEAVLNTLRASAPGVEMRRVEFVGPQVGKELTEQGGLAMLFALLMILAYVAFRFQWKFAVGAVAALVHDVILTLGFFSVFGVGFDLSVLAAVLAVIGYSLNDTIVVFDRIRENFLKLRKKTSEQVMNTSINQMLGRTIITSSTTLLVLLALFLLGGEVIHNFALALIVGILIGTYSSIYVASTAALILDVNTRDLLPPERDDKELDAIP